MDIQPIVDKFIAGENIDEAIKGLDDAKKAEFWKTASSAASKKAQEATETHKKELDAVKGLREAQKKIGEDASEQHKKIVSDVQLNLKKEALIKQGALFIQRKNLSPEDAAKVEEIAKTIDVSTVDVDAVYPRAYAIAFADRLINAEENSRNLEAGAANFRMGGVGANASGGGGGEQKTYSPAVVAVLRVNAAKAKPMPLTAEEVERGLGLSQSDRTWKSYNTATTDLK